MFSFLGFSVAILAQILNGAVSVLDKFMLSKTFRPAVYAFWISFTSLGAFLLLPFGFGIPHGEQWYIDLAAGASFSLALFLMYTAMWREEISRVIPIIGSMIPVVTMVFSYFFFGERLQGDRFWGVFVIIVGIVLLTFRRSHKAINYKAILAAPAAAILFALSSVLMKEAFFDQPFFSGLAWSRLGGLVFIPIVLLSNENRIAIWRKETGKTGNILLFFSGRFFSATGFVLVNLAYALTSPTIVNALQGIQYAFLFIASIVLARFKPGVLGENINRQQLLIKASGILMIILGTILLAT